MNFKTVVIGPLILAGVLFGGAKGFIYYRVSTELDKMISMAGMVADIRYRGISSSIEGSITVENISVYPVSSNDEIVIESVQMRGDGLNFLFKLATGSFEKKPPKKFGFSVKGFSIPLGGDLASSYTGMLKSAQQVSGVEDSDGCGLLTGLSPDMMGALGFYAIIMDTTLDIDFDQVAGVAEMELGFDVRDVQYSQMNIQLSNVPQPGAMVMGGQQPQISEISATYQIDPEFVTKTQEYCAKSRGLTVDAFVTSMLDMEEKELVQQLGFKPGPGLLVALKSFIKKPDEVNLRIHPPEAFDPSSLAFYKLEDLPSMLNLELTVNGEPVTDLSFSVPEKTKRSTRTTDVAKSDGISRFIPSVRQTKTAQPRAHKKDYILTSVAELSGYIDKKVRVYTDQENAVRKGVLTSIESDKVIINQRVYGGKMTVRVPLKDITKVEVYRFPD